MRKIKKKLENLFKEFFDFNELKLQADIKIVLYRLSSCMSRCKLKKNENIDKK